MSRELVLVAASGLAREAIETVRASGDYKVVGMVDDDPGRHGQRLGGVEIFGTLDVLTNHSSADVLVCAGKGAVRESLVARLEKAGVTQDRYATVVHPSVHIPESCTLGWGSILLAGCVLTADVRIGRHVVAMPHVTLTHDTMVEDFATLCAGVTLGGGVRIGSRAYLGMTSSVRENVYVGPDTTLGMGSVVLSDIPAGATWFGVPAHPRAPAAQSI